MSSIYKIKQTAENKEPSRYITHTVKPYCGVYKIYTFVLHSPRWSTFNTREEK